jgi:GH18 family chitinase
MLQPSVQAIAAYAKEHKLGGVFAFDSSMDSISGGTFTYELMNAIATALA